MDTSEVSQGVSLDRLGSGRILPSHAPFLQHAAIGRLKPDESLCAEFCKKSFNIARRGANH